jgi:transcriptional regulator with XRE-family HTH domain
MNLGHAIRTARNSAELRLEDVHQATGLSISYLSDIERNVTGVTVEKLKLICDALDCSISMVIMAAENEMGVHQRIEEEPEEPSDFIVVGHTLIRKNDVLLVEPESYISASTTLYTVVIVTPHERAHVFKGSESECHNVIADIRQQLNGNPPDSGPCVELPAHYRYRLRGMARNAHMEPGEFLRNILDYFADTFGFEQMAAWDRNFQIMMEGGDPFDPDWYPPDGSNLAV